MRTGFYAVQAKRTVQIACLFRLKKIKLAAAARFVAVQAKALGEIDRTMAGYRTARQQVETAESLLTELKARQATTKAMFEAGEVDALAVASAQVEFATGALARLNSLVKAQQALAALEDAVQSPVSLSVPAVGWEKNPRASVEPVKK